MEVKNKNVVITGGTDGLGYSLVKLFLSNSSYVHVIGKDELKLKSLKKELNNPHLFTYQADVSNFVEVIKVCDDINEVDVLINNAGIWYEGPLENYNFKVISKVVDVNLKGPIYVTKTLLSKLKKSPEAQIINISSTSGLKGLLNQSVYVASKMGLRGFTESLKEDLAGTKIKVSGFYPGGMNTKFFEKSGNPRENQKWMNPDKVAGIILFMVQQDHTLSLGDVVVTKRVI